MGDRIHKTLEVKAGWIVLYGLTKCIKSVSLDLGLGREVWKNAEKISLCEGDKEFNFQCGKRTKLSDISLDIIKLIL